MRRKSEEREEGEKEEGRRGWMKEGRINNQQRRNHFCTLRQQCKNTRSQRIWRKKEGAGREEEGRDRSSR
jgi:hypothetical protein